MTCLKILHFVKLPNTCHLFIFRSSDFNKLSDSLSEELSSKLITTTTLKTTKIKEKIATTTTTPVIRNQVRFKFRRIICGLSKFNFICRFAHNLTSNQGYNFSQAWFKAHRWKIDNFFWNMLLACFTSLVKHKHTI